MVRKYYPEQRRIRRHSSNPSTLARNAAITPAQMARTNLLFLVEAVKESDGDAVIALRGIAAEKARLFVIGLRQSR